MQDWQLRPFLLSDLPPYRSGDVWLLSSVYVQRKDTHDFFAVLVVITLCLESLSLAGIPVYYRRVVGGALQDTPNLSNEIVAAEAVARGMDLHTYDVYTIALNLITTVVFVGVAILLLWRAKNNWFRWYTAFVLVFWPSGGLFLFTEASQIAFRYVIIGGVLWPFVLLHLYLFPNGKAVPDWTRWPMGVIVSVHFLLQFGFALHYTDVLQLPPNFMAIGPVAAAGVIFTGFPLILFSQIYRYFRVSTRVEQAQTLWVVSGLAVIVIALMVEPLLTGTLDVMNDKGYVSDLSSLLLLLIPITIAISVLRYRLFDIDLIIRKTLIYSLLTTLLGLVYFGTVISLQTVLGRTGDGQQSPLVIVLSTLLIAALFTPMRRRIQHLIDHRFYRRRYDAVQALAQFARIARNEVEIEPLMAEVVRIVDETMHPNQIGVWLGDVRK